MQLFRIDTLDGASHFAYGQRVMTDAQHTVIEDQADGTWTVAHREPTAAVAGIYQGIREHDEPPTWVPVTAMHTFGTPATDSPAADSADPEVPSCPS